MSPNTSSTPAVAPVDPVEKFLVFHVGSDRFALPIARVRGIVGYVDVTAVPGAPADERGTIKLHGQAIRVIDLAIRFGVARCGPSAGTRGVDSCIVLLEVAAGEDQRHTVGVVVDQVGEVARYTPGQVTLVPAGAPAAPFVTGLVRTEQHVTALVDVDRMLGATTGGSVRRERAA